MDWNLLFYDLRDAIIGIVTALIGILLGYYVRGLIGRWQAEAIEKRAQARLDEVEAEGKAVLKEADIKIRAEVVQAREEFEKTTKTRRKELQDLEDRLSARQESLEKKAETLSQKQEDLQKRDAMQANRKIETEKLAAEAQTRLQRLSGMTAIEARKEIFQLVEQEVQSETAGLVRRLQEEAKQNAEREAHRLIAMAIQRYAAPHATEMMTNTVQLVDDDVKGRIIGREGRNIRTLEALTGVTMLVDDTPAAVVISGFDPIRREIAKKALELLVADGRIHPGRIEEVVQKVEEEMKEILRRTGETTVYDLRIQGVPPQLIPYIGRLRYRSSYSQNVLQHSIEVANLMSIMAGELKLDPALARRIGLFHDIGKSMDHEVEGAHAAIGADLLKRCGESHVVVNAVAAHHADVESESLYALLTSAADAISSSRPGARLESKEIYVQRLEKLEAIANSFNGVHKTFAVQAGREVRVIVDPDVLDDPAAMQLARDISRKIEQELQYPGQIRVIVVREMRCIEYAR
jgi:ribonucrease Y